MPDKNLTFYQPSNNPDIKKTSSQTLTAVSFLWKGVKESLKLKN